MLSSILGAGQEPSSAHTHPKNYGNLHVFNNFSGWTTAPVTTHHPAPSPEKYGNDMFSMIPKLGKGFHEFPPPETAMESMIVSMIFRVGQGPP